MRRIEEKSMEDAAKSMAEGLKLACQRDGLLEEVSAGKDDQNGALTL